MLSGLWNAPAGAKPMGTATTGSSEAIMLGGLALKRRSIIRLELRGNFRRLPARRDGGCDHGENRARYRWQRFGDYLGSDCHAGEPVWRL